MKKQLLGGGMLALALAFGSPTTEVSAQEFNSLYITPKISYSWATGDMSSANWVDSGGWARGVLGGESDNNNLGFGVALGNDFSFSSAYPVRLEVEYLYHGKHDFSAGPDVVWRNGVDRVASQNFNVKAHTLTLNGFYDLNLDSALTPYVGGGIGMSYLKTGYNSTFNPGSAAQVNVNTSSNTWDMAWNLGGGLAFSFSENMVLDMGYRYFDMGKAETGSLSSLDYSGSPAVDVSAHELSVGLRFTGF